MNNNDKLNHYCFPQPKNTDFMVWRYMDLNKLLYTLLNNNLFLCRLDLLNDKFEGSITKRNVIRRNLYYKNLGIEYASQISINNTVQNIRSTFVNCWRIDSDESEAMWKLYCPNNFGIAIQTSYKKLVDSLNFDEYLYIGLVTYIDYNQDELPINNMFYPVMYKRSAFEHEKEVRIVKSVADYFIDENKEPPSGLYIPWEVELIIENVYINPYAPDWYFETVEKILEKFGSKLRVKWSALKGEPYH